MCASVHWIHSDVALLGVSLSRIKPAKGDAHVPLWVPNLTHLTWDFGLKPAFQLELGTTGKFQAPE